jgi:hypothetical protein
MKTLLLFLVANRARFFFVAAIIWGVSLALLYYLDITPFHWHDILTSATGTLFDLVVFGVLLSKYEASRSRSERIERYTEQIEDFRSWKASEAAHRIAGAVRRLNRDGVHDPELFGCYLANASLRNLKLTSANLMAADLMDADLTNVDLRKAFLMTANLNGAKLTNARLMGADLRLTQMIRSSLCGANLFAAKLQGADLTAADLTGANLSFAIVDHDWSSKLRTWEVIDRERIEASYTVATDKNGVAYLKPKDADHLTMLDLYAQWSGRELQ